MHHRNLIPPPRAGFQLGYDALFNVLKEFYPDLKRKLQRKSQ